MKNTQSHKLIYKLIFHIVTQEINSSVLRLCHVDLEIFKIPETISARLNLGIQIKISMLLAVVLDPLESITAII